MMTEAQIGRVLALCATFDNRLGDALDVKAWHQIATKHEWPADVVTRIVLDHYGEGADRPRLTPAAITDEIKRLRSRAAETFVDPVVPDDLSGAQYPAWYREQLQRHVRASLDRWAVTGEEPRREIERGPVFRSVAELAAVAPEHVRAEIAESAARLDGRPS